MSKEQRNDLAGISAADCCSGCRPGRCVITENHFCGHPYKASHATATPKVNERIERARKIIARRKIEAA